MWETERLEGAGTPPVTRKTAPGRVAVASDGAGADTRVLPPSQSYPSYHTPKARGDG